MNYLQWNEHISNHFFKPVNAGKDILFYLTQQDLIKFTRQYFNGATDEDIWNDFLNAIKYDDQKKSNLIKPYSQLQDHYSFTLIGIGLIRHHSLDTLFYTSFH